MIKWFTYNGLVISVLSLTGLMSTAFMDKHLMRTAMIETKHVDHSLFDRVLEAYVDDTGLVDYASIKEHKALDAYVDVLSSIDPEDLPEQEAIAFWINAYNAYTIKLIVDHYPVGSIREISPFRIKGMRLAIPKINSPFEYELAEINGVSYSLDDIEHGILRKKYDEPRIHFALVCASISCPPLRREAFVGDRLDAQLDDQARVFLHDPSKNRISKDGTLYLSRIFNWFQKDFADSKAELQVYLATYFEGEQQEQLRAGQLKMKYLKYDWSLNEQ